MVAFSLAASSVVSVTGRDTDSAVGSVRAPSALLEVSGAGSAVGSFQFGGTETTGLMMETYMFASSPVSLDSRVIDRHVSSTALAELTWDAASLWLIQAICRPMARSHPITWILSPWMGSTVAFTRVAIHSSVWSGFSYMAPMMVEKFSRKQLTKK